MTPTGVLALQPDVEQATPHGSYRLLADGSAFVLEALANGPWQRLYRFDLAEAYMSDYAVSSWHIQHHPDSQFVNGLLIARPDTDRRYSLSATRSGGAKLSVHHLDGPSEHQVLESPAEIRAALEQQFLLNLTALPDLDAALGRLF